LVPISATIHSEDSSYSSDYAAAKVLVDDSDWQAGIWLGADGDASSWFVLQLESATIGTRGTHTSGFKVNRYYLKNTANHLQTANAVNPKDQRTTTAYTIETSADASTWTTVKTGTLTADDKSLQEIYPDSTVETKYVKFTCTAYDGAGCGLAYFEAQAMDDETDCSYVEAEGGFGTGAFGNLCHNDCSGRGICDYKDGTCQCYEGYTGQNCNLHKRMNF